MAWRLGGLNPRQKRNSVSGGEQRSSLREALRARGGAQNVAPVAATDIEDNVPERGAANLNLEWLNLQAFAPRALQNVVDKIRAGELPTVLKRGNETDGEDAPTGEVAAMSSESEASEGPLSSHPARRHSTGGLARPGQSSGLRSALQARGGFRAAQAAAAAAVAQEVSGPDSSTALASEQVTHGSAPEGTLPTVASGSPLASVAEGEEAEDEQHPERAEREESETVEADSWGGVLPAAAAADNTDGAHEPESVVAIADEDHVGEVPAVVAVSSGGADTEAGPDADSKANPPAGIFADCGQAAGEAMFEEFRPSPPLTEEAAGKVAEAEVSSDEEAGDATSATAAAAAPSPVDEPSAASATEEEEGGAEEARPVDDSAMSATVAAAPLTASAVASTSPAAGVVETTAASTLPAVEAAGTTAESASPSVEAAETTAESASPAVGGAETMAEEKLAEKTEEKGEAVAAVASTSLAASDASAPNSHGAAAAASEEAKPKSQRAEVPKSASRIGVTATTVERVVPIVASATGYPLAMSPPGGSPRENGTKAKDNEGTEGDEGKPQVVVPKPKLAAEPPRQPTAVARESAGKVKDMAKFWGANKNARGFAGPQISGTSRLSRNEAEAALQRLLACGGDLDQVRRLRKELAELELQ